MVSVVIYIALALLPIVGYALYWLSIPFVQSIKNPPPLSYTHSFPTGSGATIRSEPFPSIQDAPSVYLSLIVPAYNEEERLSIMMDDTLAYLEARVAASKKPAGDAAGRKNLTYEIIIVDDGSKDGTSRIATQYSQKHGADKIRLLKLAKNQGKGGAVQQGMLHARGEVLLMVDADGATDIREVERLEAKLASIQSKGHGVVVGSRAHLADEAVAKRKWYRNILMYGFNFLVSSLCVKNIRDTQCGFKLFTRATARVLFSNQRLRRWSFDVELLHIAQRLGFPYGEMGVKWHEIPGSKLNLLESSFQMARDLLVIRLAYTLGLWSIKHY